MKVITLNKKSFNDACLELSLKIDFEPNLIIGVLNGGGVVTQELLKINKFKSTSKRLVTLQRKNNLNKNCLLQWLLKRTPQLITDRLRIYESNKVRREIKSLNLVELSTIEIDVDIDLQDQYLKKILIVDDAVDSGKTLFVLKNNIKRLIPSVEIKTAVISWTIEESIVHPDYFLFKNILVRFPWSKDFKASRFEKKSFNS